MGNFVVLPLYEAITLYAPKVQFVCDIVNANNDHLKEWESRYDPKYIDHIMIDLSLIPEPTSICTEVRKNLDLKPVSSAPFLRYERIEEDPEKEETAEENTKKPIKRDRRLSAGGLPRRGSASSIPSSED